MASSRKASNPTLPEARLRPDQVEAASQRLDALIQEVADFDTSRLTTRHGQDQRALSAHIANEIAVIFDSGTEQEKRFGKAQKLDYGFMPGISSSPGTPNEIREDVAQAKGQFIKILREAVAWVQRQPLSRP